MHGYVKIRDCWNWLLRNKISSGAETRTVEVGGYDERDKRKHNKIKTAKYTLLTFLPKNLSEQFRRIANFYFLSVTAIAIIIDSPVSPMTSIIPLVFMVSVTAVKQGYEDWLRHRADNVVNKQMVEIIHKGVSKSVPTALVAPGMLVRVRSDRSVPADLVLMCAADQHGKCFVTTANLDGETSLKTLRVPPPLVGYTPDMLPNGIRIKVPQPMADLYTFYGQLELPGREPLPLSTDNLMLRGATLENTEWAIGCAVYTGDESKLALNSKYASNKFSSCESAVNRYLCFFIGILVLEVIVSYFLKRYNDLRNTAHEAYLGKPTSYMSVNQVLQDMFSFLLLYYYLIPMSLYVTIELYKFFGSLFIKWDKDLYCEVTKQPAVANTSDLSEDLGQVEVLFSDKTGTLTKNLMVFKACSVFGRVYEEREGHLYDNSNFNEPENLFQTDVKFFFTILALCHSVQISSEDMKKLSVNLALGLNHRNGHLVNNSSSNGVNLELHYHASSPDEKALVEAAARAGVRFMGEVGDNLLLKIGNDKEMYEKLHTIEFTSDRKRMSVILKDKNGKIWLFCKGADSTVLDLCKPNTVNETIIQNIYNFAKRGLRILAVAYREISQQEYDEVVEQVRRLQSGNLANIQKLSKQYEVLEKSMNLVGATAVEDCLQDDVADTLAALRRAAIRIWVLTGDKVETAINVAQSCGHISENEKKMFLIEIEDQATLNMKLQEFRRIINESADIQATLIVDGTTMAEVLERPCANLFAEIALKCNAVLCCRLSPLQKALIVKLIKQSPEQPITAAIGDGANDISMIQEAHVGFGIFGKEGNQAVRSADFAFAKFSMLKKMLLVLGHWYYQRLATLTLYFFYKNLMFVNFMLFFQAHSQFSTQSVFDSMYLTFFNLFFASLPCLILSFTEQTRPVDVLLREPELYMKNRKNRLMGLLHFGSWSAAAIYHSVVVYIFTWLIMRYSVIRINGTTVDLWCFGAAIFHYLVIIVNLKLMLHARYNTAYFIISIILSLLGLMAFDLVYTNVIVLQTDGDVLGTYLHLLSSLPFWSLSVLLIISTLLPDYCYRAVHDLWFRQSHKTKQTEGLQDSESTRF